MAAAGLGRGHGGREAATTSTGRRGHGAAAVALHSVRRWREGGGREAATRSMGRRVSGASGSDLPSTSPMEEGRRRRPARGGGGTERRQRPCPVSADGGREAATRSTGRRGLGAAVAAEVCDWSGDKGMTERNGTRGVGSRGSGLAGGGVGGGEGAVQRGAGSRRGVARRAGVPNGAKVFAVMHLRLRKKKRFHN